MQRLPSMIKHSISKTVFKWVIIVAHPQRKVIEFLSVVRGLLTAEPKSHRCIAPFLGFPQTLPHPTSSALWFLNTRSYGHKLPRKLCWECYWLSTRKGNGATTTELWTWGLCFFWQCTKNPGPGHSLRALMMPWAGLRFNLTLLGQKRLCRWLTACRLGYNKPQIQVVLNWNTWVSRGHALNSKLLMPKWWSWLRLWQPESECGALQRVAENSFV